jgi:hypothetical protein
MSDFKYLRLCDINFYHAFYKNGYCARSSGIPPADLDIVLSAETSSFFQKYALRLFSGRVNGTSVYGEVIKGADGKERLKKALPNDGKWVFTAFENNPDYSALSDKPLDVPNESCLYLTNLQSDAAAAPDALHLTTNNTKVNWQADVVPLITNESYIVDFNGDLEQNEIKLTLKNSTYELYPTGLIKAGGKTQASFKLNSAQSGLYVRNIKGTNDATFYFLNKNRSGKSPMAVIELYWNNQIPDNYQWQNPDKSVKNTPPAYRVNLGVRKTEWRYELGFKHLKDVADNIQLKDVVTGVQITSSDIAETFDLKHEIDNRRFLLASHQPLELAEETERRLSLKYKINGDESKLELLPQPTSASLQIDQNQLVSKILLNQ